MRKFIVCFLFVVGGVFGFFSLSYAADRDTVGLEILQHEWHPETVWERIGKTKFVWKATVMNRSNIRKRVFVYYDLLDADNLPLAQNVANRVMNPHQTVEIISDSYIQTPFLPKVKNSRATIRVGFPE